MWKVYICTDYQSEDNTGMKSALFYATDPNEPLHVTAYFHNMLTIYVVEICCYMQGFIGVCAPFICCLTV